MSSFKKLFPLVSLIFITACGFQPLYGNRSASDAPAEFSQIQIKPIKDRIGQILHNHLLTSLNPKGPPANPLYSMTVKVSESSTSLGVRKSAFATRANLTVTANFKLTEIQTGRSALNQISKITVSYNILDSDFASLSAEKDARSRALREIGEDIRTRVGIFFTHPQTSNETPQK